MLLSIIIPTRNRSSSLQQCLQSLTRCAVDSSVTEICVVDDCSCREQKQKNVHICRQNDVRYQFCAKHEGPAHARNAGLFATSGEWGVFLDDDVCVDTEWYAVLGNAVCKASQTVAGIEGVTRSTGQGLWDREVENIRGGLYLTSNIAYRRECLMRTGMFDESFRGPYAEDHELALRIKKWGDIQFNEKCIVFHQPRTIHFVNYCLGSFARMHVMLDAEYHLYTTHKDSYHTIRHATNFWSELGSIVFKHVAATLKRRTLSALLRKPLQALALTVATLLEQISVWLLVPKYMLRLFSNDTGADEKNIDRHKTSTLWGCVALIHQAGLLQFKQSVWRSVRFRFVRIPVYNACTIYKRLSPFCQAPAAKLFLRIDDVFLRDSLPIGHLCDTLHKAGVPFMAALTGKDLQDESQRHLVEMIVDSGGSLALHGFTHEGKFGPYPSEILQMSFPQLAGRIASCKKIPLPRNAQLTAFVPPFNAVTWEQVLWLSMHFPVVCTGPESIRFARSYFGPLVLSTGGIYFPSCSPFYTSARQMMRPALHSMVERLRVPVGVTFHMQVEAEDRFASLAACIQSYRHVIARWQDLQRGETMDGKTGSKAVFS